MHGHSIPVWCGDIVPFWCRVASSIDNKTIAGPILMPINGNSVNLFSDLGQSMFFLAFGGR